MLELALVPLWETLLAFVFSVCLTLFMLIYSKIRWQYKLAVSLFSIFVFVSSFFVLTSSFGWPYRYFTSLPGYFEILWVTVDIPVGDNPGHILYWLKEVSPQASEVSLYPRVYQLPYSKPEHEQASQVKSRIAKGERVFGQTALQEGENQEGSGENSSEMGGGYGVSGDYTADDATSWGIYRPPEPEQGRK